MTSSSAPTTDRPTSSLSSWRWPLIIGSLLVGALIALALLIKAHNSEPVWPQPDAVRVVRVAVVSASSEPERLRLPGLLRATDQAELGFLHAGHLAERRVRRGQTVAAGEMLALLHNPVLSPGLSAAEARLAEVTTQLEQAERELVRITDLHRRKLVATEEFERIKARRDGYRQNVEQARAQQLEASEQLAEASLRAPFAGIITEIHVEPGEFVAVGQPVLALAGKGALEVALDLGPERAARLQAGQVAQVSGPLDLSPFQAQVIEVGLARPGRPARVRLALIEPPPNWLPGMGVQVELEFSGQHQLSVPLAAVLDPGAGSARIFRIEAQRAMLVPVALGPVRGGQVLIDGPVTPGDLVVIAGHGQLLHDERVRVLP